MIDQLFERLAMREPEHIAVKQYAVYKQAPGKTAASINISLAVRLSAFNLPKLAALTAYDELNLPALGERKGVLFAILPDNDSSFNFLIGMLYTQLFQELPGEVPGIFGVSVQYNDLHSSTSRITFCFTSSSRSMR